MELDNIVYLNGEYLPLSEAKVSVLDRGFLFGDGVYEVIPVYSGHLFHLTAHLQRLKSSLLHIKLDCSYTRQQWLAIMQPLLNGRGDQYLYLQITRGVAPKRDHAFPKHTEPSIFAMCSVMKPVTELQNGVKALTMEDNRWEMCQVKATTLLANVLLRQQAVEQGCAEAILIRNGWVTEGAASNLFAVIDGVLTTPKKTVDILPGITRQVVLELAKVNGMAHCEAAISIEQLQAADEIWITSSTREIVPVIELDGKLVNDGKPGVIWQTMNRLFQQHKTRHNHE